MSIRTIYNRAWRSGLITQKTIFLFKVILLISCFGSKIILAQKGSISIPIDGNLGDTKKSIELRLYSDQNQLIYKTKINDETYVTIDSIDAANYNIKLYTNGILVTTMYNIKVVSDSVTHITALVPEIYYTLLNNKKKGGITTTGNPANFAIFGQTYQPGFSSRNETVNSIYAFGFRFTPLYKASKHYAIGAHIGSSMGFCKLQKDKLKLFPDTFDQERYYYWKISVALNNRFIFMQPKEDHYFRPLFLDLSIGYNFPVMYRYVGANEKTKSITRYITNFNDFSAMARLGFGWLSFTGEYQLTNSIKSNFPDAPHFMVGIEFIIPNND